MWQQATLSPISAACGALAAIVVIIIIGSIAEEVTGARDSLSETCPYLQTFLLLALLICIVVFAISVNIIIWR